MEKFTREAIKMFSISEKMQIAKKLEEAILEIKHPEMPTERPVFHLHVEGKEAWSFAKIEPNWTFELKKPGVNPWNELMKGIGRD